MSHYYPADQKYFGLRNQGSTCYLNCVLQVLNMTPDFREAVIRHAENNPETVNIDRHLSDLFVRMSSQIMDTRSITDKLGIRDVSVQRDAAEFFEKILNQTSNEASQIFHGQLTHRFICRECDTETNTLGPFWSLPLALTDSDNGEYSVAKGIQQFFRDTEVGGLDQMYCDKCEAKADAVIKCEMTQHPEVLMLLLKRFEFDWCYMEYIKISCSVEVPYILQIPKGQRYELYAVVDHCGTLRGGHYTTTIRPHHDTPWTFNDTAVWQNEKFVERSTYAYLLFYRKVSTQPCTNDDHENMQDIRVTAEVDVDNEGNPQETEGLPEVGQQTMYKTDFARQPDLLPDTQVKEARMNEAKEGGEKGKKLCEDEVRIDIPATQRETEDQTKVLKVQDGREETAQDACGKVQVPQTEAKSRPGELEEEVHPNEGHSVAGHWTDSHKEGKLEGADSQEEDISMEIEDRNGRREMMEEKAGKRTDTQKSWTDQITVPWREESDRSEDVSEQRQERVLVDDTRDDGETEDRNRAPDYGSDSRIQERVEDGYETDQELLTKTRPRPEEQERGPDNNHTVAGHHEGQRQDNMKRPDSQERWRLEEGDGHTAEVIMKKQGTPGMQKSRTGFADYWGRENEQSEIRQERGGMLHDVRDKGETLDRNWTKDRDPERREQERRQDRHRNVKVPQRNDRPRSEKQQQETHPDEDDISAGHDGRQRQVRTRGTDPQVKGNSKCGRDHTEEVRVNIEGGQEKGMLERQPRGTQSDNEPITWTTHEDQRKGDKWGRKERTSQQHTRDKDREEGKDKHRKDRKRPNEAKEEPPAVAKKRAESTNTQRGRKIGEDGQQDATCGRQGERRDQRSGQDQPRKLFLKITEEQIEDGVTQSIQESWREIEGRQDTSKNDKKRENSGDDHDQEDSYLTANLTSMTLDSPSPEQNDLKGEREEKSGTSQCRAGAAREGASPGCLCFPGSRKQRKKRQKRGNGWKRRWTEWIRRKNNRQRT